MSAVAKDVTGQRFGRLKVVSLTAERRNGRAISLCVCDCGKRKKVVTSELRRSGIKSCGCLRQDNGRCSGQKRFGKFKDITGQRFGRMSVLSLTTERVDGRSTWLCGCDCGKTKNVRGDSLRSGQTKSCGCMKRELQAAMSVPSFDIVARRTRSAFYPHSPIEDVKDYLTRKQTTRKVEQCLTQTR